MLEDFERRGCAVFRVAEAREWSAIVEQQRVALMSLGVVDRPWIYWELHNPWSRAAAHIDSWQLLDICQAPAMIECLSSLIGEDIVLFDSQIVPNPALPESARSTWQNDGVHFPLDGDGGVVVRLPVGSQDVRTFEFRSGDVQHADFSVGRVLVHAAAIDYRPSANSESGCFEYVMRFFPADRLYVRDAADARHIALTEMYPWVNYRKFPLWLVSGEDRAGNDFVTGFHTRTGRWTRARTR